jgi:arginyl-tRNA synthetase
MNEIEKLLIGAIKNTVHSLLSPDTSIALVGLQETKPDFEGQFTLVTFPLAKHFSLSPEATGEKIGHSLVNNYPQLVSKYNVVKGFLNISVSNSAWLEAFRAIYKNPTYGTLPKNKGKVMVEYSSPNTNKPLHLGHLRTNFLGYSVAQILENAGYDVVKVNLVNDRGVHICKSMLAYMLYGNNETPNSAHMKGDHLVGKYYVMFDKVCKEQISKLIEQGMTKEEAEKNAPMMNQVQELLIKWENGDEATMELWSKMNDWVYEGFEKTYTSIGVDFDKYYYESNTYLLGKEIVQEGLDKNVFYKKSDGSVWINLEKEGLDEKLILRADGTSVYITQDLGTAELKYKEYACEKSIYVVGNEQDYHFKVLKLILEKLGKSYANGTYHLSYGMVDLPSGKMKSREGTVVDADDLVKEMIETAASHTQELGKIEGFSQEEAQELYKKLGLGALKYFLLKVDPKKRMLFNPQESIEFQGNTGPFVQYTYARIAAILRKAEQLKLSNLNGEIISEAELHEAELALIIYLSKFQEAIVMAAEGYAPSIIAQYVYELAKSYNRFYTECSIFNESSLAKVVFRVALSKVVSMVIKKSMKMLGIDVPEKM